MARSLFIEAVRGSPRARFSGMGCPVVRTILPHTPEDLTPEACRSPFYAVPVPLILRPASRADAATLSRWDRAPHVIVATTDDPAAQEGFADTDWSRELDGSDPASAYFIAEVDGRPIGCMQVIDPARERTGYWGADTPPGLRAMDIWIGEKEYLGQGYGTRMMALAIDAAFADPSVAAILLDPLASNEGAHRFYRRLGFRFVERRLMDGDDTFVFRLERDVWVRLRPSRDSDG